MERDYPTKAELKKIAKWDFNDFAGLMEFVKELWHWDDYIEQDGNIYKLHTGGWSGNEDIINALAKNSLFWLMCWVESRRGGHYIFELRKATND